MDIYVCNEMIDIKLIKVCCKLWDTYYKFNHIFIYGYSKILIKYESKINKYSIINGNMR